MHRFMALMVLVGGMLILGPIAPANAANATPGCITRAEYRAVKLGTTEARAKQIIGATGKTTSEASFPDGDGWKTKDFRQCGRTWNNSFVSFDLEKTESEVWVSDLYCDDFGCEDWGGYETKYTTPYVVVSRYAYWS